MNNLPLLNDLRVFMLVARRAGFAAVAEEFREGNMTMEEALRLTGLKKSTFYARLREYLCTQGEEPPLHRTLFGKFPPDSKK